MKEKIANVLAIFVGLGLLLAGRLALAACDCSTLPTLQSAFEDIHISGSTWADSDATSDGEELSLEPPPQGPDGSLIYWSQEY